MSTRTVDTLEDLVAPVGEPTARARDKGREALTDLGRARLVGDAPWFDDLVVRGHRPLLAVEVAVEEVFFHCSKAFLRSGLWDPATWEPEARVPRRAVLVHTLEPADGRTLEELGAYYGPSYAEGLYT